VTGGWFNDTGEGCLVTDCGEDGELTRRALQLARLDVRRETDSETPIDQSDGYTSGLGGRVAHLVSADSGVVARTYLLYPGWTDGVGTPAGAALAGQ
jgi:hypothetical protein